eukprot:gene32384-39975_t
MNNLLKLSRKFFGSKDDTSKVYEVEEEDFSQYIKPKVEPRRPVLTWNHPLNGNQMQSSFTEMDIPTIKSSVDEVVTTGKFLAPEGVEEEEEEVSVRTTAEGSFTYQPSGESDLTAGRHTILAIYTPVDLLRYRVTTISRDIVVEKAVVDLIWGRPIAIPEGDLLTEHILNCKNETDVFVPGVKKGPTPGKKRDSIP